MTLDKQNMKKLPMILMFLEAVRPQSQIVVLGVHGIKFTYELIRQQYFRGRRVLGDHLMVFFFFLSNVRNIILFI